MKRYLPLVMMVIFALPVVLATLLNSQWIDWQPAATRNHGTLIEPVAALPDFSHPTSKGHELRREDLLGRWVLIHVAGSGCDKVCLERLYWLRQVRLSQEQHPDKIGLWLITDGPLDSATLTAVAELAADIEHVDGAEVPHLVDRLLKAGGDRPLTILCDPQGNAVLAYPGDSDPNGIRKDLDRLLTWTVRNP